MHIARKLALLPLLGVAAISMAQDASHPFDRVPGCVRENSSRLSSACREIPPPPIIIRHELESSTRITVPEVESLDCQAEVSIRYQQRNTIAKVDGTIENESCAASSGSFVISIGTMGESSELKTQEFSQSWRRDDDQLVTFSADYEIGENVDLVRVRALSVQCRCDSSK